jgi:hypothetical protein
MDVKTSGETARVARVLVVADWAVDPERIVAACRRRAREGGVRFGVVVPAWLHGVDWIGDPYASRPCAARQLQVLEGLAAAAGLHVERSEVGDPDPMNAIEDLLAYFAATELLICTSPRRFGHPFDLVHRVRRASGLTVREVAAGPGSARRHGHLSVLRGGGHCGADLPQAA